MDIKTHRYYDSKRRALTIPEMIEDLENAIPGSFVLMQPICHNPTGIDPSKDEWKQIV